MVAGHVTQELKDASGVRVVKGLELSSISRPDAFRSSLLIAHISALYQSIRARSPKSSPGNLFSFTF